MQNQRPIKILCVIPSRINSTRLPRKPLQLIQGKPMVEWVYRNASSCAILTKVVVATDSQEVADIVKSCGGEAILTDPALKTGSDRVAAVASQYPEMEIVINLQGDEPFIKPQMLEELVAPYLRGESPEMTTLAYKLTSEQEYYSHDIVKVITDLNSCALYFSRSPLPYFRSSEINYQLVYHHIGIYAFRRDFLLHYTTLPQTPLEQAESLEQLRALEHGYKIKVSLTSTRTLEINQPKELAAAQYFKYNV